MNVLLISGKGMKLGSVSKFWTLAPRFRAKGHTVRAKQCLQTGPTANKVTVADVQWADIIIGYSWGTASLWHIWFTLLKAATPTKLLVVIAGVPDAKMLQFGINIWHAPTFVKRAVCFDVCDVPNSYTFQNPGAVDIDCGQAIPDAPHVNVNCGNLFPVFAIPGYKHVNIIEKQLVLDSIVNLVGGA